jgi:hypothetical protein
MLWTLSASAQSWAATSVGRVRSSHQEGLEPLDPKMLITLVGGSTRAAVR